MYSGVEDEERTREIDDRRPRVYYCMKELRINVWRKETCADHSLSLSVAFFIFLLSVSERSDVFHTRRKKDASRSKRLVGKQWIDTEE